MAAAAEHHHATGKLPQVADEIAWDLLRDEWELLMAVGSGPTPAPEVARRAGEEIGAVIPRLGLLAEHGLLRASDEGYRLVTVDHQRQEGMSSYVRDLVLRRIELGGAPPVGAQVRFDVGGPGDLGEIVRLAEDELLPRVVTRANAPETERSQRFLLVIAVCGRCQPPDFEHLDAQGVLHGAELVPQVLRVVRGAAIERSRSTTREAAKLWVAEMRVDPEVADDIIEDVTRFMGTVPAVSGTGAAAFAVWPVAQRPADAPPGLVGGQGEQS
jgi:hypothetical protein